MLTVPVPTLPMAPPVLEKPVEIAMPGASFPDGAPVLASQATMVGLFVLRGGDVWDQAGGQWKPAPPDADLAAMTPLPAQPDGAAWKAMLVATGIKDQLGADVYAEGPAYQLRGFAKAWLDGSETAGLSAPTAPFSFTSTAKAKRFKIAFDTDNTPPEQATVVRLQLRDDGFVTAGFLEIRASGREVELASCDGAGTPRARVLLRPDGSIRLIPGGSQSVYIDGDLEVERIHYQPLGGGPKVWL